LRQGLLSRNRLDKKAPTIDGLASRTAISHSVTPAADVFGSRGAAA
jgi:hypothetical protein